MAEPIEHICARILSIVESRLYSIRLVIEGIKPRAPRGLLNALCLGVLRNYKLLVHGLRRCGYQGRLRGAPRGWLPIVGAYEALYRSQISLERIETVTGLEKKVLRCLRSSTPAELVSDLSGLTRLSVLYSIPRWVVEKLSEARPPRGLENLLEAFQKPMPLWIRFNRGIVGAEKAVSELERIGIVARPDPVLDDVLEVIRVREGALGRLDKRLFYVQDRSAALVAHLVNSCSTVLDLFSAPGNKAAHVTWRMKPAYVVGLEASPRRAGDEKKLVREQNAWVIDIVHSNAALPPLRREISDLVLVDPDCTSMGRLGHSPETRLFLEKTGPWIVERFARLQRRGLRRAVELARRGARIIYSTCTLTLDENEHVVQEVAEEEGLHLLRAEPFIGVEGFLKGTQRIYPHVSRCAGGFVALLAKV